MPSLTGPFSVVSANDNQIKQTGIMEFAPTFLATPDANSNGNGLTYTPVRPTNAWPVIRSRTAKLRFTKEKEHESYSGKDTYQGDSKESYHGDAKEGYGYQEPDRKDSYYADDSKDYGDRKYYRGA